jgi:hypothetical protein
MAKNGRTEAAVALSPLLTSAAMEALRRYADLRPKWRSQIAIRQKRSYILPLVHWLSNPISCLPFHRQTGFWEEV